MSARPLSLTRILRTAVPALLLAVLGAGVRPASGGKVLPYQARPAVEGNRAPYDLVFSADGKRAFVSETAEGTVAVVDVPAGRVAAHWSTGGARPAGLALTPDGARLLVANTFSGSVAVLSTRDGHSIGRLALPGMPYGVAVAPDGKRAYVSVSQLDEVAVVDLASLAVTQRIPVGRRPRALEVAPDGSCIAVANLASGSVSVINADSLKPEAEVRLKGINVRGVAIDAESTEAYTTAMPAFNGKPASDPLEIWHNVVQSVRLQGESSAVGEDQWMDFARLTGATEPFGTPDQGDLVMDREAKRLWVTSSGRDVLTRITIHDRKRDAIWPISQIETPVGANPRGLALSPDGKQVWVANHLGNSLSVVDADSAKVLRTIDLGRPSRVDPTLAGQYLFNNAALTRSQRFTCNSCHPDGSSDGLTWQFVHVKDGVDRRNTRDLRAGIGETAPFRWSGFNAHLRDFIDEEVTGLLGGPRPTPEQAKALEAAVGALRLPPNPYRASDGELTPQARAGQALFDGKAGCLQCHTGPLRGGTGLKGWVGTTPEGKPLDVPHLAGAYDSAPYLHDGRAATLEAVFAGFPESTPHGRLRTLTVEEQAALLRYLREL